MPRSNDDDELPPSRQTRLYGALAGGDAEIKTTVDPLDPANYPATVSDTTALPAVASPQAGDFLAQYRIGDVLGRGGMGEVLSAHDKQIGRSVAIKRLRVENPSPDVLARFLREARIQGRLEHPAVVPVHELWHEEGGQPFFVMKQLAGTTLADVLPKLSANDPKMIEDYPRQRLLRAFVDVCLAIEFAHTRGVVHRDLKPANIALGDFGEVYVLDWGIARVESVPGPESDPASRASLGDIDSVGDGGETVAGSILGTPGYISPEQIRGDRDLDGRADVYALGCILFEILALVPLHPRNQAGIASALAGVDARASIRSPDRDIPPELDAICVAATLNDRHQRFATARQLGTAVQRFLDGNRDLALRKQLARKELAAANHALALGDDSSHRRDALRAAARALALDPTDRDPADLVGRLMIESPAEVPPEVEAELERIDLESLRSSARFGLVAAAAYLIFFPILYWIGFRDTWYLIAGPAVCVFIIWVEIQIAPKNAFMSGYLAIAGNLAIFALFAWMVSPVVIGPGPAIIMVTLLAAHRRLIRPWLLALLTVMAMLVPWGIEALEWSATRTSVVGSDLVLHTAAEKLDPMAMMVALVVYLVALVNLAALLSRLQDDDRRRARRTLQLQSWQLRQLVPRVTSNPPE